MAIGDRDFDGKPGSDSDYKTYDRVYNSDGYNEFSAPIESQATKVRLAQEDYADQVELAQEAAMRNAQSRVHYWPSVGKFIIPHHGQNTWAAHAHLIKDDSCALYFNPDKYVYFDKIIAEKFPAINAPENAGLRTNIAVLRNDIIGFYMKDGAFDPGDEKFLPCISSIAKTLGNALANDTPLRRPITRSINAQVANVEAVGAAEMYKFLLKSQDTSDIFENMRTNVRTLLGMEERNWGLPKLQDTPFSPANLSAALLPEKNCAPDELAQVQQHMQKKPSFVERYAKHAASKQQMVS